MRITLVINSLGGGGAERVLTRLAGGLARAGHRTDIVTLDPSIPDFYQVPSGVARTAAKAPAGECRWYQLSRQLARMRALRRAASGQGPDLLISFVDATNILTLAAFRGSGVPVIVCEHTDPSMHRIGPHWELLRRLLYPSAARVVMLTEDALRRARSMVPAWNAVAIPNPVPAPVFAPGAARPAFFGPGRNAVAMGRLYDYKGFDLLLRAFAGLAGRFPDWNLTILGEGPERAALETLRSELGLAGRVAMPGASPAPHDALKFADLFVLPSRYEGFGMALAEAMACGVAPVSFDCPSGPGTIIRHGVDGLLVPPGDTGELAEAMASLMGDDAGRKALAARAPEVVERFSEENYLKAWEELIRAVRP